MTSTMSSPCGRCRTSRSALSQRSPRGARAEGGLEVAMRRRIRDVMTREVVTVDEETLFKEITQLLADGRISAVPVLDPNGRVVGIVSEADLLLKEEYPDGPPGGWLLEGRRRRATRAKATGDTAV